MTLFYFSFVSVPRTCETKQNNHHRRGLKQLWNKSKTFQSCFSVLFRFRFTRASVDIKVKQMLFCFSFISVSFHMCERLTLLQIWQRNGKMQVDVFMGHLVCVSYVCRYKMPQMPISKRNMKPILKKRLKSCRSDAVICSDVSYIGYPLSGTSSLRSPASPRKLCPLPSLLRKWWKTLGVTFLPRTAVFLSSWSKLEWGTACRTLWATSTTYVQRKNGMKVLFSMMDLDLLYHTDAGVDGTIGMGMRE